MNGIFVIIERELLGLLRLKRSLAILVTVAVAFALVVLLKWPSDGTVGLTGERPREVFQGLAYAMLAATLLIIPVFPATSLVREVQQRTLELLLNSPLSRLSIYFGKVTAMIGFVALLLLCTLPAMMCCYAMGGLNLFQEVIPLYLLILSLSIELIVAGLVVGTYARNTETALKWAYACGFCLVLVPVFPNYLLQGGESLLSQLAGWLYCCSPVASILQLTGLSAVGTAGIWQDTSWLTWYLGFAAIVVIAGSIVCIKRLNHSLLDRSRSQGIITDDQSKGVQAARRFLFLIDPQRRSGGIPGYLNPVMAKEFRSSQFGRLHWLLRLIAGCAVLSLLLTLATTTGSINREVGTVGAIIIVLQVGLIILLTPGFAAGMISAEIENGGWNLLRVTPLSPGRILRGKLLSVIITLTLVLCATLPGYAILQLIQPTLGKQIQQVVISLVITAMLCLLVSATISSFFKTTAAATAVSYLALLSLFAGTMLVWANRDRPFSFTFVENVLQTNPMAAALNAMQVAGFENYSLVPSAWFISGGGCIVLLVILYVRLHLLTRAD
ncbi:MAG: ABC transporter permease subunit [Fuerstiella sp.]